MEEEKEIPKGRGERLQRKSVDARDMPVGKIARDQKQGILSPRNKGGM